MYRCTNCGRTFEELQHFEYHGTYESYYGVSNLFGNSTPMYWDYEGCPYCESDEVIEEEEEDE